MPSRRFTRDKRSGRHTQLPQGKTAIKASPPVGTAIDHFELVTNAPPHWPRLQLPREFEHLPVPVNSIVERLEKSFEQMRNSEIEVRLNQLKMFSDGFLRIPLSCKENHVTRDIFVFEDGSERSAGKFNIVSRMYAKRELEPPVYYAPGKLNSDKAFDPLEPFAPELFELIPANAPYEGTWSMYAGETRENFATTPCIESIDQVYRLCAEAGSYIYAHLGKAWGLIEDLHAVRSPYPQTPIQLLLQGPDELPMLFSISSQRGIRFLFQTDESWPDVSDKFWSHFAMFCQRLYREIIAMGLPLDGNSQTPAGEWWNSVLDQQWVPIEAAADLPLTQVEHATEDEA